MTIRLKHAASQTRGPRRSAGQALACAAVLAATTLMAGPAHAATPVSVDGVIGAEWTGYTPTQVTFDASAPTGNFQSPGSTSNSVAYEIFSRADADFAYFGFQALTPISGLNFSNVYLAAGVDVGIGSTIGFEIINNRAFVPGSAGFFNDITGAGIFYALTPSDGSTTDAALEIAVPWSYFETDPQSLGFDVTDASDPNVQLRLSQTFGYSVAGGSSYGAARLGELTDPTFVPEPASMLILGIGLAGLAAARRKRNK